MVGEIILPQVLIDAGISLDSHSFRYRRDGDLDRFKDGVSFKVSSITDEIEQNSIWHSAIGALNDPFEIYARVNIHEFDEMTDEQRVCIWLKLVTKLGNNGLMALSRDEILRCYKEDEARLRKTFYDMNESSTTFQDLITEIRESIGVACFTSICNSRLMWGYYCNGFSGVCLIYNKDKLRKNKVELEEVSYFPCAYEINIINFVYNCNDKERTEILSQVVKVKHSEWAHEVESRSVVNLYDEALGKGQLMKTEDLCIDGVIVGSKVRDDVKEKIKILADDLGLKLFSAEVDYQIFGVRVSQFSSHA